MPQLIQNGDVLSGTSNNSANILYSEPDGSSKNVQEKIEELDSGLEGVNNNLSNIITVSGNTPLTANVETPLVCANGIENGTYLVLFWYGFEANTQGHVTLGDSVSSGYTTNVNNYVQVCNIVKVTDGKVTVTLFSTSNQSGRNWRTKLIRLGL